MSGSKGVTQRKNKGVRFDPLVDPRKRGRNGDGRNAPMDETALAVIGGKTRGLGSSGKQASCLEIEGPRTSPKTGAPNDRQGHQSVTPATDRGHGDPPAQPQNSVPVLSATSKSLPISWAGL